MEARDGLHWGAVQKLRSNSTPPAARYSHTAVWDGASNRMLVFGGYDNTNYYNDVWAYSGDS